MGGEDSSSSPPIIAAVLLNAIVALIGCGPTVRTPNGGAETRVTDHAVPS
jgi:hypothetical protein